MTCGACTSAVEGGFADVAGVKHFSISLLSERAVIEHDAALLPTDKIIEIIEDRGFDAKILSTQFDSSDQISASSTQFKIYGNPDAEAAKAIEAALLAVTGIVGSYCTHGNE